MHEKLVKLGGEINSVCEDKFEACVLRRSYIEFHIGCQKGNYSYTENLEECLIQQERWKNIRIKRKTKTKKEHMACYKKSIRALVLRDQSPHR